MNFNREAIRLFRGVLVGLCAILCGVTAYELVRPYRPAYPASSPAQDKGAVAAAMGTADEAVPPMEAFSEITERPLFREDRRPFVPPPAPPQEPEMPPPAEPDITTQIALRATIIIGDKRIALIQVHGNDEQQKIRQGEAFNGWTLADVQSDSISMKKGDEVRRIELNTGPS